MHEDSWGSDIPPDAGVRFQSAQLPHTPQEVVRGIPVRTGQALENFRTSEAKPDTLIGDPSENREVMAALGAAAGVEARQRAFSASDPSPPGARVPVDPDASLRSIPGVYTLRRTTEERRC